MTDKFCYVPFKEFYYEVLGKNFSSCCLQQPPIQGNHENNIEIHSKKAEWFNNIKELNDTREAFTNNQQPATCNKCWQMEDNNEVSLRKKFNVYYNYNNSPRDVSLEVIDLRLGNQCNLQCKMCWPGFSDQIAKNMIDAKIPGISLDNFGTNLNIQSDIDNLDHIYDMIMNTPTLRIIKLSGGEPFIMNNLINLLEKIVDAGRTDIELFVLSNATTVTSKLLNLLSKFKKVEISCSIDGTGKYIEYQRFPCKWSVIDRNFKELYNETNIKTTLTPCWSQLNLLGLFDFLVWTQQFPGVSLAFNEVTNLKYLSWNLVPLEYRQTLIAQLKTIDIPDNYKNFVQRIEYEFEEISAYDKNELSKYAKLWDYNNKISYVDFAPWGHKLIS